MHIAKTAGGALKMELPHFLTKCVNASVVFETDEGCYRRPAFDDDAAAVASGAPPLPPAAPRRRRLTMLRSPRSHVISQFMMLRSVCFLLFLFRLA